MNRYIRVFFRKLIRYLLLFIKHLLRFVLKPLSFVPAIVVMYMIFSFSGQDGVSSAALSYKVSSQLVTIADETFHMELTYDQKEAYIDKIHYYVRKCAHFTEYFILAVTVAFPLYVYGMRGIFLVLFAGAFCIGFACLDEYHQMFVAGRSPARKDVIIDSCGAFLGIFVTRIICFIGRKTIFAPLSNKPKNQ